MGIKFIVERETMNWPKGHSLYMRAYNRHSGGTLKLYTHAEADVEYSRLVKKLGSSFDISIIAVEEDEIEWNNQIYVDG